MILTSSRSVAYQTHFTNGEHSAVADTVSDKGGTGQGFRPHELLEAALASCMNMTLRMAAEKHGIQISGIEIKVSLDRRDPEAPCFVHEVRFDGDVDAEQRRRLLATLERCPVRKTLMSPLRFAAASSPPPPSAANATR